MGLVDETHNPELQSWVRSSRSGETPFPIQNLPLGVFKPKSSQERPRVGVRIGDSILDLQQAFSRKLLTGHAEGAVGVDAGGSLNALMSLAASVRRDLRRQLSALLQAGGSDVIARERATTSALVAVTEVEMLLPADTRNFIDCYASLHHATSSGRMLRPGDPTPLLPNWKWMPLGYHGRPTSLCVSGTSIRRPTGQTRPEPTAPPVFGPTAEMDFELELGFFVGPGQAANESISIDKACSHIAGFVIVNDWSARDIQTWEASPLGPFQSKSFATSISPWVVTAEAISPFRAPAYPRPPEDPQPLPHLWSAEDQAMGGLNIQMEAALRTSLMRKSGMAMQRITQSNTRELYWTFQQMVAHQAGNGTRLFAGDLVASGTVSGTDVGTRGCLLEATHRGRDPLVLSNGEKRTFLEDGDEVVLTARCEREGFIPIGFGECAGLVSPSVG